MPDQLAEILKLAFSSFGAAVASKVPETIQAFQSTVQWSVLLFSFGVSTTTGFIVGVAVTFLVRMAPVRFNILSM